MRRLHDRRKKVRREELIQRAIEVIQQKGYRDTSLQDIADEFNVTKAALYYYIRSKEDLLYEIYKGTITHLIAELEDIVKNPESSLEDKLRKFIYNFVYICINNPEMEIFFQEKDNLSPEHFADITKDERRVVTIIASLLEEGMKKGIIRNTNAKVLTFGLLGMSSWVYRWYSKDGALRENDIAETYLTVFLYGCHLNTDKLQE